MKLPFLNCTLPTSSLTRKTIERQNNDFNKWLDLSPGDKLAQRVSHELN